MLDGGARIDGRRVKELRRALLLSQRELAQLAGVVTETVNRIERQPDRTFRPDTVRHLAKVLGVDPHELMVVEEPEDAIRTWRKRRDTRTNRRWRFC
jgi:transcriptional regulator with XRE-family HTH domain